MKIFAVLLLTFITCTSYAQLTGKEKRAARKGTSPDQPTTLNPGSAEEPSFKPSHSGKRNKKSNGPTYNAQKEFEERMEARGKTYRKNEKMLMRRQFNDPSYFGHKHKPKKHSANKMKFCKECGIRH
ncbi:MAG: hypothetical protein WKF87_21925 [Chryseolinea sp.]